MELLLTFLLATTPDKTAEQAIARAKAEILSPSNRASECYSAGFLAIGNTPVPRGNCREAYRAGVEDRVRAVLTGKLADI